MTAGRPTAIRRRGARDALQAAPRSPITDLHLATHGVANNDLANVPSQRCCSRETTRTTACCEQASLPVYRSARRSGCSPRARRAWRRTGCEGGHEHCARPSITARPHGCNSLWNVSIERPKPFCDVLPPSCRAQGASESLRTHNRTVRRRHPEPFYWGAFTIVGEGGDSVIRYHSLCSPQLPLELTTRTEQLPAPGGQQCGGRIDLFSGYSGLALDRRTAEPAPSIHRPKGKVNIQMKIGEARLGSRD